MHYATAPSAAEVQDYTVVWTRKQDFFVLTIKTNKQTRLLISYLFLFIHIQHSIKKLIPSPKYCKRSKMPKYVIC